jgi:hypothetical protein
MPLDFLSVKNQIQRIIAAAPAQLQLLDQKRNTARDLLLLNANRQEELRLKVQQASAEDSFLRSAFPTDEPLDATFPLPEATAVPTLIAADGSQISPNRHEAVNYHLINLGAIQMTPASGEVPRTFTRSELHVNEYSSTGTMTDDQVSQLRDKSERVLLAELAAAAPGPVITLTDGPLELWGGRSKDPDEQQSYLRNLEEYTAALAALHATGAATAGYVDKPRADLVVRALEVSATPLDELADIRHKRHLRGVTDNDLFAPRLQPGERSAIFGMQSQLSDRYPGPLALHFFYLNVGNEKNSWLARVEIPLWVAQDATMLASLHSLLIAQCGILGGLSYPYALHRAHEIALVSKQEKDQVTQMILGEMRALGLTSGLQSHKQAVKELAPRTIFGQRNGR